MLFVILTLRKWGVLTSFYNVVLSLGFCVEQKTMNPPQKNPSIWCSTIQLNHFLALLSTYKSQSCKRNPNWNRTKLLTCSLYNQILGCATLVMSQLVLYALCKLGGGVGSTALSAPCKDPYELSFKLFQFYNLTHSPLKFKQHLLEAILSHSVRTSIILGSAELYLDAVGALELLIAMQNKLSQLSVGSFLTILWLFTIRTVITN